jgi:hypothetical protein
LDGAIARAEQRMAAGIEPAETDLDELEAKALTKLASGQ